MIKSGQVAKMKFLEFGFKATLFVSLFAALSQAAVLEDVKKEAEMILQKPEARNSNDYQTHLLSTIVQKCTLPTIDYGSFSCKTATGISTDKPGDGDVCELTCDAGLFLVDAINHVVTCRVYFPHIFGLTLRLFDKIPSCRKYDILHLSSPSGDYKLNFDEAKELCESNGARLATFKELTDAYKRGLHYCSCGFVSESLFDKIGYFPIQSEDYHCGAKIGINACTFGNFKWNAWCHM